MANKSKLQYPNKKQYIITIPKAIVLAKGWKPGDHLEFVIDFNGDLIIRKIN